MTKFTTQQLLQLGFDENGKKVEKKKKEPRPAEEFYPEVKKPFIFIPGEVPSSKNSKQIGKLYDGKPILRSSDITLAYKKEAAQYFTYYRKDFVAMSWRLGKPMTVFLKFVRGTQRDFDQHNMIQIVADMMVEHEWIKDDNARNVVFYPTPQVILNKALPGVYIFL